MTIRVRFAPSPTGNIHIGNARPALINWLFALQNNGEFVLRFDDTDIERSKEEYVEGISRDLDWLGIKPHIREMVAHYSNLKMPVEILHGDADTTVPLDIHARPLSMQLPNANLNVLQGVGHMPHHAEPDIVIDAVARVQARASLRESH